MLRKILRFFKFVLCWTVLLPLTLLRRRLRGCCLGRFGGCLIVVLLFLALAGGALFWAAAPAEGAPAPAANQHVDTPIDTEPLAVYLLIDNSNSMFEKGGVGSDPDLLRIDAARLFISYLGVDDGTTTHACGILFFGSEPQLMVPLTDLRGAQRRAEIFDLIAEPPRMGWTDQAAALELAALEASAAANRGRPVLVMATDGKPEWDDTPTAAETDAYIAELRQQSAGLAERDIPLFIILLANAATDADPAIDTTWKPLWTEVAAATPPGRFYEARRPQDLVDIYHDIVVTLTGGQSAGAVVRTALNDETIVEEIAVETGLARLTLVISKSDPALAVTVRRPDGTRLQPEDSGVRLGGSPGLTREEIWAIDNPAAGTWQVEISGDGSVTVWKDYRPVPASTPTSTPPTPTVTPRPTTTPAPTATATAQPQLQLTPLPAAILAGQSLTVSARLLNPPAAFHTLTLSVEEPAGTVETQPLLDDGRQGDAVAGDGLRGTRLYLSDAGTYLLSIAVETQSHRLTLWEMRLLVEQEPRLLLAPIDEVPRAGQTLPLVARWEVAEGQPAAVTPATAIVEASWPDGTRARLALTPDEEGLLRGELPLEEAGAVTIRTAGSARTPAGQTILQETENVVDVRRPFPWPLLGAATALLAAGLAGVGWRTYQRRRPMVTGTLRGAAFPGGASRLSTLHRQEITIGATPADVVVPDATGQVTLRATRDSVNVRGTAGTRLNDTPLRYPQTLSDGDRLALGPVTLTYENLRLRAHSRLTLDSLSPASRR